MRNGRDGRLPMALCAAAMALGWGLRGFIGGGPLGAMIPGAMIGLVLAALLKQERQAAWLAACGAVGFGLGGQETYGQTVGLSLRPETYWWALLGFALKGGAWGLAGGGLIGAGLLRGQAGWSARRLLWGLAAMLSATWAGWRLVNAPKLVYFSDPLNKPREEVWAGLLAGALAFLAVAAHGPLRRIAWRFALWTCAGGALGFPLGAALQAWGRGLDALRWFDWWKGMEFTLGALLGLGLGAAAWISRRELAASAEDAEEAPAALSASLLLAAAAAVVVIGIEYRVALRFNYSVGGALALAAALQSSLIARHVAITVTIAAFLMDFAENTPALAGLTGWALVVTGTALAAVWVRKEQDMRLLFLALMWSAVAVSLAKTFVPPLLVSAGHLVTEGLFVLMALACSLWLRRACTAADEAPAAPAMSS
ncbi:MAG: hypothetical protein KatS3mg005_2994 [Bryobacteraceae bacterium]|nr:MAG: hypothetical protein KatS3mg005_2994 [Bryobacteraceae bacterium]